MPANFLHGLEVIETTIGPLPVTVVKSAVIGLIGSAPMFAATGALQRWNGDTVYALGAQILDSNGNVQQVTVAGTSISTDVEPTWATAVGSPTMDNTVTWKCVQLAADLGIVNKPTLVGSVAQAAAFGPMIQGFSIPYALSQILEQGSGQVIVINVFDITRHNTTVTAAPYSMPAIGVQAISLGRMGVGNVKVTNVGAGTTYINGTDFTLDQVNGVILAKNGGAITVGEALLVTFTYADPSKIQDSDLVGTFSGGVYTGIQALKTTYNTMGFWAKILIAPRPHSTAAARPSARRTRPWRLRSIRWRRPFARWRWSTRRRPLRLRRRSRTAVHRGRRSTRARSGRSSATRT